MTIYRLCNSCGDKYPMAGRSHGKCPDCMRTYERERARSRPQRLARNSARFKKLRELVRRRDGHACRRCGSTENLEAHHVKPLSEGGAAYDPANLLTICAACHFLEGQEASRRIGFREKHWEPVSFAEKVRVSGADLPGLREDA